MGMGGGSGRGKPFHYKPGSSFERMIVSLNLGPGGGAISSHGATNLEAIAGAYPLIPGCSAQAQLSYVNSICTCVRMESRPH